MTGCAAEPNAACPQATSSIAPISHWTRGAPLPSLPGNKHRNLTTSIIPSSPLVVLPVLIAVLYCRHVRSCAFVSRTIFAVQEIALSWRSCAG